MNIFLLNLYQIITQEPFDCDRNTCAFIQMKTDVFYLIKRNNIDGFQRISIEVIKSYLTKKTLV